MTLSFTFMFTFAICRRRFRKGTEPLLSKVPKNARLLSPSEGFLFCRLWPCESFAGASGKDETERDMVVNWEGGCVESRGYMWINGWRRRRDLKHHNTLLTAGITTAVGEAMMDG
jgi:hypothetical protein